MNKFEFNVSLFGNMTLEVIAPNHEEAERILKDTIESINIKEIKAKDVSNENVNIKKSEIQYKSAEIKDKERGR
ncbi:MAG: hypothetical protein Q4E39_00915 [bacterium]|nr:hypothetical protein [bacterium]